MKNKTADKNWLENSLGIFYSAYIKNLSRNLFIYKILLIIEIIPIFVVLDEVIFIKSTNHIIPLFYFLSPSIWERLIENNLSYNLAISDEFIMRKNKNLNFKNSDSFVNFNNDPKWYFEKYLINKNTHLFRTCINFFHNKNHSQENYLTNKTVVFHSQYYFYYDKNFVVKLLIILIFLLLIVANIIILFNKKHKFLNYLLTNLLNLLMRNFSTIFIFLSINKIYEFYFLDVYAEIDPSFTNTHASPIQTIFITLLNSLIFLCFLCGSFLYFKYTKSYDHNYPYDFLSNPYDKALLILKVMAPILYNLEKSSCAFGDFNNQFFAFCFVFVIFIFLIGVYFLFYFKKIIRISNINKLRCCIIFVLNIYLIFKIVEFYFDILNVPLNYILWVLFFFASLALYFSILNQKVLINIEIKNFIDKEQTNNTFYFNVINFFNNALFSLSSNKKKTNSNVQKNPMQDIFYLRTKNLKHLLMEILVLAHKYLDILKHQGRVSDQIFLKFFVEFMKRNSIHKIFCERLNLFTNNNSKPKFLVKSLSFMNDNKNSYFSRNQNIKLIKRNHKERNEFLYVQYVKRLEKRENHPSSDIDYNCCDYCSEKLIFEKQANVKIHNLSIYEMNQIISNFFNAVLKSFFGKLNGYLYYEIYRVIVYYINTYNTKVDQHANDTRVLFDLQRNLSKYKKNYYSKEYLLFEYYHKKILGNRKSEYMTNPENKILNYLELNYEYEKFAEYLQEILPIFKTNLKVDEMIFISKKIFKHKKRIKQLISIVNSDNIKDPTQEFYVGFHYIYCFNSICKKLNIVDINMDVIDIVEENLEKNDKFLFEFKPESKNLVFRSINAEFLSELKYEFKQLKDKNLSNIFPFFISSIQMNKVLNFIENKTRDNFKIKFLIYDANKNLKYLEFSFKVIISLDLKTYLYAKYKNFDYIESEIISQCIFRPQNLLVIHEKGWIMSQSESFAFNIFKNEAGIRNFFEFVNLDASIFLNLFFSKKYLGKSVDLKGIIENVNSDKPMYLGNKYGNILLDFYENEIINFVEKQDNMKKSSSKNISQVNHSFIKNELKYIKTIFSNEKKDYTKKNVYGNNLENLSQVSRRISLKKFEVTQQKQDVRNKRFIEVNTFDLFKLKYLKKEQDNFYNYRKIKVMLEDVFKFQDNIYFVFDFDKVCADKSTLKSKALLKSKRQESTNFTIIKNMYQNENFSELSMSLRVSSTVTSNYGRGKLDDHVPNIIKNQIQTYIQIKDKNNMKKIEYWIYSLNCILIMAGIVFIIVLNKMLQSFNIFFNEGYYKFRILEVRYVVQTLNIATFIGKKNDNYAINYWNDTILNSNDYIYDFIKVQNDLLKQINQNFEYFLSTIESGSGIAAMFSKKISYFDTDKKNSSFIIKYKSFPEILSYYYSNLLIVQNGFSSQISTNLSINELTEGNSVDTINSLLIIFKNYFPVIDRFYRDINTYFTNFLEEQINNIANLVFYYNMFFLSAHYIIILILIFYIYKSFIKLSNIFIFLENFDDEHLRYLSKKIDLLLHSTRLHLSPREFIRQININRKLISDLNKNDGNKNNNLSIKKYLNMQDAKNSNEKIALDINEYFNKDEASKKGPYKDKQGIFKSNNLKLLEREIKSILIGFFLKPIIFLAVSYLVYFLTTITILNGSFGNITAVIKFTNSIYEDQTTLYNGYITLKLAYLSSLNVDYIEDEINITKLNKEGSIDSKNAADKYLYLNKFEDIFKKLMMAQKKRYEIEKFSSFFSDIKELEDSLTPDYFCEYSIDNEDIIFMNLQNSNEIINSIKNECKEIVAESFSLDNFQVEILNEIRKFIISLLKMDLSQSSNILSRDKVVEKMIKSKSYKSIANYLNTLIRPYFNKFRDKIITPFLIKQLNNTLFISVVLFVSCVFIDVLCLIVLNYFILKKSVEIKRYLINFIDILKK